ncbi:hypothetical protein MMC32_008131 [Xylographa parallela]|nr:hypothetical protein [Xylographa parallela]
MHFQPDARHARVVRDNNTGATLPCSTATKQDLRQISVSATTQISQAMPSITTYHCLCTNLLLATPYPLPTLPQRQPPSLDHARILPFGKPPSQTSVDEDALPPSVADISLHNSDGNGQNAAAKEAEPLYSLLLNTTLDRRPIIVEREDGFEKRWVRRCGRCRTAVGYVLGDGDIDKMQGEVLYVLEEGLVETEELRKQGALAGE